MQANKVSVAFAATLAFFTLALPFTSTPAACQREKVLFSFQPLGGKIIGPGSLNFDAAGNLYAVTGGGGAFGDGSVFELSPTSKGKWTQQVLHSFSGADGRIPTHRLIFDAAGNLYGTTDAGGAYDLGTVYELSPKAGGGWTEKVLHSFSGAGTEGSQPFSSLVFDAAGNLYGTTNAGGAVACLTNNGNSCGTVFELSPAAYGSWNLKTLYIFHGPDGAYPAGNVVFDAAGNLYGTTLGGGPPLIQQGTVFELSPTAFGPWKEKVLYSFKDTNDGNQPQAGVIFDAYGNLYGTTPFGGVGTGSVGTVFELSPTSTGDWSETVLYNFSIAADGAVPWGGLMFDGAGNLYGTTSLGGAYEDGTVFELSPAGSGNWTEKVLFSFDGTNGYNPQSTLIMDAAGNLYGTTIQGGAYNDGNVFEILP